MKRKVRADSADRERREAGEQTPRADVAEVTHPKGHVPENAAGFVDGKLVRGATREDQEAGVDR